MKKPLSGKKWFYAQGQSLGAKGVPWYYLKSLLDFYALPFWARKELAAGHLLAFQSFQSSN